MTECIFDVSSQDFERDVIAASATALVIVDFWAPWCGPCRALGPILEKLAREYRGRFILAKVNSDDNPELARRYGVRGIPSVKAFLNGQLIDEFSGALPESSVRAFIDDLLPSPAEPLRQEALAAQARGDAAAAKELLSRAIALDPRNEAVRLDLAETLLDASDIEGARALLDEIGDEARDMQRAEASRARLTLAAGSQGAADAKTLEARVAADPADLDARFELANVLALRKAYRSAMEHLLELVRRDRGFRDDAGRKTLLTLFNLLGPDDDRVREFRRLLAALLHR